MRLLAGEQSRPAKEVGTRSDSGVKSWLKRPKIRRYRRQAIRVVASAKEPKRSVRHWHVLFIYLLKLLGLVFLVDVLGVRGIVLSCLPVSSPRTQ
jgi:hypothetical protein